MDVSQGDVKRQVSNVVKAVMATYKFQTMGEYRALLSLYNVTVEEARGMVDGREYHGLVYFPLSPDNSSATNGAENKVGNPFAPPVSASPSATKPCSAGLNFPKDKFGINVWRR